MISRSFIHCGVRRPCLRNLFLFLCYMKYTSTKRFSRRTSVFGSALSRQSISIQHSFFDEKGLPAHVHLLRQAVPSVTKDDLFWAFTVVLTRGFDTAHGTALAPLADDFNTDLATNQNAQWHAKPGGSVEISTTREVKKGAEFWSTMQANPST